MKQFLFKNQQQNKHSEVGEMTQQVKAFTTKPISCVPKALGVEAKNQLPKAVYIHSQNEGQSTTQKALLSRESVRPLVQLPVSRGLR